MSCYRYISDLDKVFDTDMLLHQIHTLLPVCNCLKKKRKEDE